MRAFLSWSLLVPLLVLTACFGGGKPVAKTVDPTRPSAGVLLPAKALRAGDLPAWFEATFPPTTRRKMEASWSENSWQAEQGPELDEAWRQLRSHLGSREAIDQVMADLNAALRENRGLNRQIADTVDLIAGMVANAPLEEDMTPSDREQLAALLRALATWMRSPALANPMRWREAVAITAEAVREVGLERLSDLGRMPLPQALTKIGVFWKHLRRITALFGLDLDATLDSVTVQDVGKRPGDDRFDVLVTFDLLGETFSFSGTVLPVDGRYYPDDPTENLHLDDNQAANLAAGVRTSPLIGATTIELAVAQHLLLAPAAMEAWRKQAYNDLDADGGGEYPTPAQLAGREPTYGQGKGRYVLEAGKVRLWELGGGESRLELGPYVIAGFVPDGTGGALDAAGRNAAASAGDATHAPAAARHYAIYARPADPASPLRSFAVTTGGVVSTARAAGPPAWSDAFGTKTGPADQVFGGPLAWAPILPGDIPAARKAEIDKLLCEWLGAR